MSGAKMRYLFKVDQYVGDGRKKRNSVREIYVLAYSLEDVSKRWGINKNDIMQVTAIACDHTGYARFSNPTLLLDFTQTLSTQECA
jgi:hypothetical protein